ncbi:MAG: polyprenyl synthetase family protein [Gammaproteobacteria bacterium]|nr:polyprenyl synthetase family protein [Pseudomonadales bacterium]MCP5347013.1 polyprenyl synthetase family protein [Pseudomonadales bacterium]
MDTLSRIQQGLASALATTQGSLGGTAPPLLTAAMQHAVFAGGSRIRPRLCLAVASACSEDQPQLTDAAAAAIELLHCASLVHDDLPCFDDAAVRRGKPTVHRAFGEPLAVLTGDALIVLAFQTLTRGGAAHPDRLSRLLLILGSAVGAPGGIVAGQAWECESQVVLADYQRAKTGALFAGVTMAGAAAAGRDPDAWRLMGEKIGEAYQVADDIHDVTADPEEMGKPGGRDVALDRPSAARELGLEGAIARFKLLVREAVQAIPDCPGAAPLRAHMLAEAKRFLPEALSRRAA